jgi:hypothetical protein
MSTFRRMTGVKSRSNVSKALRLSKVNQHIDSSDSGLGSSSESENESSNNNNNTESYINSIFNSPEKKEKLNKMRESIAYVYIRAHSSLPYDDSNPEKFDTYTMPDDMKLTKITAAVNGEVNCNYYDYQDKKDIIIGGIRAYYNKNKKKLDNSYKLALRIQEELRHFEDEENKKGNKIPNSENRNVLSHNKTVLNKIIYPFSENEKKSRPNYMTVQILYLDEIIKDEDGEKRLVFASIDIYNFIHQIYRESVRRLIIGSNDAIKIADIIKFLYEYLKLKDVVLLDFSCSSYPKYVNNQDALTDYLNKAQLHGGKYKSSKNNKKTNKRTKKYKKNNRKTKK